MTGLFESSMSSVTNMFKLSVDKLRLANLPLSSSFAPYLRNHLEIQLTNQKAVNSFTFFPPFALRVRFVHYVSLHQRFYNIFQCHYTKCFDNLVRIGYSLVIFFIVNKRQVRVAFSQLVEHKLKFVVQFASRHWVLVIVHDSFKRHLVSRIMQQQILNHY